MLKRLPSDPPAFQSLTEAKLDAISAVILLSSAELEDYVEGIVNDLIGAAFDVWRYDGRVTPTMLSCLHTMHSAKSKEKIAHVRDEFGKPIDIAVRLAIKNALNTIRGNHGINEDNLTRLLNMVGADTAALSSDISVISSFTKKRGSIAHLGSKNHGVTIINSPSIVRSDLLQVLQAIKVIDQALADLKAKCASPKKLKAIRASLPAV